jgi:hypothetical protein
VEDEDGCRAELIRLIFTVKEMRVLSNINKDDSFNTVFQTDKVLLQRIIISGNNINHM